MQPQPITRVHGSAPAEEAAILYGDSSPFPYEIDFIAILRAVVDGCAGMLTAQATIDKAVERLASLDDQIRGERWKLESLVQSIIKATSSFHGGASRLEASAAEVLYNTRAIVERERAAIDRDWGAESAGVGRVVDDSCIAAYQALEKLLLSHLMPESRLAWRLVADEAGYEAVVKVGMPCGLEADFAASVPDGHAFGRVKRVTDFAPGTSVNVPRLGRRRGERQVVRVDKLFLSEAILEPERIVLVLRRGVSTGAGYRFEIAAETEQTQVWTLDELGQPAEQAELDERERRPVLRLAGKVLDASFDLPLRRHLLLDAKLDGHSLRQRHEPREVCARILQHVAPIVREIDRRSGAPGELILRRNLGGGRREAVFVTKSELYDRLRALPSTLRQLFAPLGLVSRAR